MAAKIVAVLMPMNNLLVKQFHFETLVIPRILIYRYPTRNCIDAAKDRERVAPSNSPDYYLITILKIP